MAKLHDTPENLARIQAGMITKMDQLSDQLEAEEITIDEWARKMGEIIAEGSGKAYRAGSGAPITDREAAAVARFVAVQLAFLENFAADITAGGWIPSYRARAQMYATATRQPFSMGDVRKQAGRALPLPSMPTEGTICHTNCKCEWEIVTVNGRRGDFDAYWRLGTNDNCQTCIQRAADWAPVQIREGVLL